MPIEPVDPDLRVSLHLDAHAPRAARFHVAQVDRPAPDLRDAVVLLTSELVTRAVQQCPSKTQEVELRVWMPSSIVRVELRAPREVLCLPLDDRHGPEYDVMLLAQVADRWSIDSDQCPACVWFEIDRNTPKADPKAGPSTDPTAERSTHPGTSRRRWSIVRRRHSAGRTP
jgi:hypothetical protein